MSPDIGEIPGEGCQSGKTVKKNVIQQSNDTLTNQGVSFKVGCC